jgi:ABC-2 type transport system ATP-binding protein
MGFEGLITANAAVQYKHCVLDTATIDDIIICIGKGGTKA